MWRRVFSFAAAFILLALLPSCTEGPHSSAPAMGMKDGYYTAEAANFDHYGWKEYITIYVSGGQIVTVEYDAFNAGGFIKSWDIDYMRTMNRVCGTYPNKYTRTYAVSLLNWQSPDEVDAVTGATTSHVTFQLLATAAIEKSKAGDKEVAHVDLPEE